MLDDDFNCPFIVESCFKFRNRKEPIRKNKVVVDKRSVKYSNKAQWCKTRWTCVNGSQSYEELMTTLEEYGVINDVKVNTT